jgi:uncharacterized glyoxalase superfamily protein PhnB
MFQGPISAMLYVSDLKRSVEFYAEKLGFVFDGFWDDVNHRVTMDYEEAGAPSYASLKVGETPIGLHLDPEFSPGKRRFELHVQVEAVDAYHATLSDRGVSVTAPKDEPWGARMFSATDPDGHVWDFMQDL